MIKIGRYRFYFSRYFWVQTHGPIRVKKVLFMTIIWEARPTDVDKEQQFPLGTPMECDGRKYRYWRAPCTLPKGSLVTEDGLVKDGEVKDEKGIKRSCLE